MARRSDHTRSELRRMALDAARDIIGQDGLRGLTTRRLAKAIGYTPGTLYQLFDDVDALIVEINMETLDALYARCHDVDFSVGPEAALMELAARYAAFTAENPRLWNALFEFSLPEGRNLPKQHTIRIVRLLGLAERALAPLFPDDPAGTAHEAAVLWSCLYGIVSLAASDKLTATETAEAVLHSLVTNYVAGLRFRLGKTA